MTPPNQTFVDAHLGLFDISHTGTRQRMVKHAKFPYGMVYLTSHLGKNIFRDLRIIDFFHCLELRKITKLM